METAFEAAFVAGFAVVGGSFVAILLGRASGRTLLALTGALALAAGITAAAFGINLVSSFADRDTLAVVAAGLGAATVAQAGLYTLFRGLRLLREEERLLLTGRERIAAALDEHVRVRTEELETILARERANAGHALSQQERKLAQERRDVVARQADRARAELARSIEQVQERLEQRLAAWAADLDRGQRSLEARLNELAQRQSAAIKAYEARLAADSDFLRTAAEEQQTALARLRAELEHAGQEILEEGRAEMEAHGEERRRVLAELTRRVRDQERELRDHLEREENDAMTRITASFADVERRQRENLERLLDRAAGRLADEAERRFDVKIRDSREKTAQRLSNELDKAMDQFARRAEKEISDRINEAAQTTAARLERRVTDLNRAAEGQAEVAAERVRRMGERLDEAIERAERRVAAFERQTESEPLPRPSEAGRSVRTLDT